MMIFPLFAFSFSKQIVLFKFPEPENVSFVGEDAFVRLLNDGNDSAEKCIYVCVTFWMKFNVICNSSPGEILLHVA